MKILVTLIVSFCVNWQALAQKNLVTIKNSSNRQVAFVKYDEFGNYHHFQILPGKTTEIPFEHDYLNIFALENDRDVPYFFFDGDEAEVTMVSDGYYTFNCDDLQRKNELQLAVTIFKAFLHDSLLGHNTDAILQQTGLKIDSIVSGYPAALISPEFKLLVQMFYRYERLGRKQKFNSTRNIEEAFDQYWQRDFNYALQSYILTFRSYVLTYLPKFLNKDTLLKHLNHRFGNEHKEIAMYTSMHMSYYRDRAWFRSHIDEYNSLSKDKNFAEKLSYFKLTDDVSKNAGEIILISPAKDTTTLKQVLARFKGKVLLLDLWASWCVPCLESLPHVNELAKSIDEKLFQVIYLNLDRELHLFNRSAEKNMKGKLTYNLVDNFNSPFAKLNKVTSIPRYMILDKQGNIVNASAPPPADGELKSMIERYL